MNWLVYALFAYLFLAMHHGLAAALQVQTNWGLVVPQFVLIYAVFIGFFAPRRVVMWAWGLLGFALDLLFVYAGGAVLVGPCTLGMLAGAVVVIQLRSMVLRTHPISHGFCVAACGLGYELVAVGVLAVRNFYDAAPGGSPLGMLGVRLLAVAYTAALAVPIAWVLVRLISVFGFQGVKLGRR